MARNSFFMDAPLSDNRSNNLLVYVAAVAAVVALFLGIASLVSIGKVKKQLGDVNLVELDGRITNADTKASAASTEARGVKNDIRNLQLVMQREIEGALADIRGNIARVEDMAKQAMDRPAVASSGGGGGGGGGSGVVTAPPGSLDADGAYVIKSGDNFGKVAQQFGVSVADVIAANPGVDPRRLRVGQKIIVPQR